MDNNKKSIEIEKMFKDTFNNPAGIKCMEYLKEVFVDKDIYRLGSTFEETAFRQGRADIVKQIIKQVKG